MHFLANKTEDKIGEVTNMIRDAGTMKLLPGKAEEYERRHRKIWPELIESIKSYGAKNYSIFLNKETNELFSYLEIEDPQLWEKRSGDKLTKKWWDYMADIMEVNPDNSPVFIPLGEVFHLD